MRLTVSQKFVKHKQRGHWYWSYAGRNRVMCVAVDSGVFSQPSKLDNCYWYYRLASSPRIDSGRGSLFLQAVTLAFFISQSLGNGC